jgi:molybdopterin molybdotransferase
MAADGNNRRTPVADVLRLIDDRVHTLDAERIASLEAAGRMLAARVVSPVNVPSFAKSAMDGFAIRSSDSGTRRIIGASMPGRTFASEVQNEDAVRITTGAPIPPGADCVVPLELADETDGEVQLRIEPVPGKHVIRIGEDVAAGTDVLAAGRVLRPQDIGLLAAIGVSSVEVVKRPRVAILANGNELLPPGSTPSGSQIVDSNSPMLAALIARDGGTLSSIQYVPDDRSVLRKAIQACDADLLLISGGSSAGSEDHAAAAVAELGELAVHGVAMKPGAPAGVGFIGSRIAFLLPGNPGACLAAYDLFAGRAMRILGGREHECPYPRIEATLATDIESRRGRMDVVMVKLYEGRATPIAGGPSRTNGAVEADGFILVPPEVETLTAGTAVAVFHFNSSNVFVPMGYFRQSL